METKYITVEIGEGKYGLRIYRKHFYLSDIAKAMDMTKEDALAVAREYCELKSIVRKSDNLKIFVIPVVCLYNWLLNSQNNRAVYLLTTLKKYMVKNEFRNL
jgi:hypothetical protein